MVSYCDHWMSVVVSGRPSSTIASKDISSLNTGLILILLLPSFIIVRMVPVHCISRSPRLKIDFRDEIFKNLLV